VRERFEDTDTQKTKKKSKKKRRDERWQSLRRMSRGRVAR
jgi:hypothetical protein